jgi:hypothetical protein
LNAHLGPKLADVDGFVKFEWGEDRGTHSRSDVCGTHVTDILDTAFGAPDGRLLFDETHGGERGDRYLSGLAVCSLGAGSGGRRCVLCGIALSENLKAGSGRDCSVERPDAGTTSTCGR